ncbi:MAG: methionine aminotransferase [Bernardetiaceae bacterium]|jgi:methionine aminotransferase|nr:methionine aminotransferase [Bernardetiaceae bacterium]
MRIESKLPQVGTTIFTVMSGLAAQVGAINLSQGFPDFDCAPELTELVAKYLRQGFNQYAPMPGLLALRERIAEKTERLYGRVFSPDTEITVTSGATEALYAAVAALVRPGDEVIVLEPCYDCYLPAIELNGGVPVCVPLRPGTYAVDWPAVRAACSLRTRAIMINSPHNPTGSVLTWADLAQLADLVRGTDICIISDEVYEHICLDGEHQSVLRHPDLWQRSLVMSSFGKTFHVTGWKVGYCVAKGELAREFRKVHQFLTFSTVTPIQHALADFLADEANYLAVPDFFRQKRDKFRALLAGTKFDLLPCHGTYFQVASYTRLSSEGDYDLALRLTREIGVATIPLSVFFAHRRDDHVLRFCFAKKDETLERAAERLHRL